MEGQIHWIFILALPVACIAWTVTKEEVFKEPRTYFIARSKNSQHIFISKFFYMLTCEYCFSHYVTILLLAITDFTVLYPDWRGYIIAGFAIVWMANVYMSLYNIIRIDLKKEKIITQQEEEKMKNQKPLVIKETE